MAWLVALLVLSLLGTDAAHSGPRVPLHLRPSNATAPSVASAPAASGLLERLTERHVCYHLGLGSAWTATLPFWLGSTVAQLLWGAVTWPVRMAWRYLLSYLWAAAWPWLHWVLTPAIWVLTSWVVTCIPSLLYWCITGTLTFLGSWAWFLVSQPLSFLLQHGATLLAVVWAAICFGLSWLLVALPALLIVGLLGASFYLRERLERKDRVKMWLAAGALTVLWVSHLFHVLATVIAAVGLPAAYFVHRELARHTELSKRNRIVISCGIAVAAVFGSFLLIAVRLVLTCPFHFTAGYSFALPAWLAALLGNGAGAGVVGVLLTLVGLFVLVVFWQGVLPVFLHALWREMCRRRCVLRPPAVMYRTLTPAMPQYSVATLGLQNCIPLERVERILVVSALHREWQYASMEGHEFLVCVPAARKEVDCHLRLTCAWCSSHKCLICRTCHAGLARQVPLSEWVKLPRLTAALFPREDIEYLLVCRARQPTGLPPWWTRRDPSSADAVWVQRHRLLPVYLVCLTPGR
eukprot:GGOE01065274.1.p2 GENE.GGOE01065274.1~~GGOE01065274.1.p2  ORF type:complete len:521 (+),score=118.99 GGOE01065274.1:77-1639(+)